MILITGVAIELLEYILNRDAARENGMKGGEKSNVTPNKFS